MPTPSEFYCDVLDIIKPIMRDYGYTAVKSDYLSVQLNSQSVEICISYDENRGCEVGFGFRLKPSDEEYDLGVIYRELEVPGANYCCFYQEVLLFLRATCDILQMYCRPVLAGDEKVFKAIGLRRNRECEIYALENKLSFLLREEKKAWDNKRYQEYIDLLKDYRGFLKKSDCMKLDYASKRVHLD